MKVNEITEALHLLRTPAAAFTEAHVLAGALHQASSDDCKLALIEFCKGLLIGHRSIAEIEIACHERDAHREKGDLH